MFFVSYKLLIKLDLNFARFIEIELTVIFNFKRFFFFNKYSQQSHVYFEIQTKKKFS